MDVCFANKRYKLVFTDHARQRMSVRDVTIEMSIAIIETGTVITKERKGRFWVYKNLPGRTDNSVCLSIVVEDPNVVVVTALINWRPNDED